MERCATLAEMDAELRAQTGALVDDMQRAYRAIRESYERAASTLRSDPEPAFPGPKAVRTGHDQAVGLAFVRSVLESVRVNGFALNIEDDPHVPNRVSASCPLSSESASEVHTTIDTFSPPYAYWVVCTCVPGISASKRFFVYTHQEVDSAWFAVCLGENLERAVRGIENMQRIRERARVTTT
jgi:hypothetical protein